jgi:hypothetical protein
VLETFPTLILKPLVLQAFKNKAKEGSCVDPENPYFCRGFERPISVESFNEDVRLGVFFRVLYFGSPW